MEERRRQLQLAARRRREQRRVDRRALVAGALAAPRLAQERAHHPVVYVGELVRYPPQQRAVARPVARIQPAQVTHQGHRRGVGHRAPAVGRQTPLVDGRHVQGQARADQKRQRPRRQRARERRRQATHVLGVEGRAHLDDVDPENA
jgi:hypothetical protein